MHLALGFLRARASSHSHNGEQTRQLVASRAQPLSTRRLHQNSTRQCNGCAARPTSKVQTSPSDSPFFCFHYFGCLSFDHIITFFACQSKRSHLLDFAVSGHTRASFSCASRTKYTSMLIGTAACVESPAFAAGLLTFLLFFCGYTVCLRNVHLFSLNMHTSMHSHLHHARSPLYDPLAGLARSFLKKR